MNVARVLSKTAARYPRKKAILFESDPYTFQSLAGETGLAACLLKKLGVKKGDRVAIQLPKSMDFIFFYIANLSIGGITLPLNPAYKPDEVEYFLKDSGSSLFITTESNYFIQKNAIKAVPGLTCLLADGKQKGTYCYREERGKISGPYEPEYPTREDDIALICYTSGTTGKPKGAMITHKNLIDNVKALTQAWKWKEQDILLHVLPIFHVHGLNVALLGGLFTGSTIVMFEKFEPSMVWKAIENKKATMLMGVPTMYHRLLNQWESLKEKPNISSMRVFISGSAPLSESLFNRFEALIDQKILERYGMTEAGMIATNPFKETGRKPGSVGYAFPGVRVRVADKDGEDKKPGEVGEIYIQGSNVFKGYWKNPVKSNAAFKNSWLKSGDLGYQDPKDDMRLFIVGREKDLIITGGYNVYPKEIENIIDQYEGVLESAAIGLNDDDFGERVAAVVVMKKKTQVLKEDKLIDFCKKHLAGYKCPKIILFRNELPRNAMGKVQKQVLKKEYSGQS